MLVQSSFHQQRFLEELRRPSLTHPYPQPPLSVSLSESLFSPHTKGTRRGTRDGSTSDVKEGGGIESKVVVVPNGIAGIEDCDGVNDLNTFAYGRYSPTTSNNPLTHPSDTPFSRQ